LSRPRLRERGPVWDDPVAAHGAGYGAGRRALLSRLVDWGRTDGSSRMKCPYCGHVKDRVVDSRESRDGDSIRRRRQCLNCARRFTSYERIDEIPYMVVKKDGGREKFERNKILSGLLKACEKRPVSLTQLEKIVDTIEQQVQESPEREIDSVAIGKTLLHELRRLDKVAYLRFASVYLEFEDVTEFMTEINELFEKKA